MPMMFYKDVSTSDELRAASRKAAEKLEAFEIQMSMRDDYYNAIKAYKDEASKNGEWDKLSKIDQRFVEQCMQDFELNGLSLPKETRVKLQQIQKEIGDMERVASQNINEDKTKVEVEEKLLKGMPQHLIETLKKVPNKEGFRFVTMQKTDINPALKLVQDEKTRERLSFAMGNKAVPANSKIVEEIVAKRHEMALMLGHASYSEYTLMKKMAKNPITVQSFEEDLTKLII
jgi:Zn-dependent oligopeptidase